MLVLIDNEDSFTYNLVQYFQILGEEVVVLSHHEASVQKIHSLKPQYLVISPGPNSPLEVPFSVEVITHFYKTLPILGVCLGHQCLAFAFNGTIHQAPHIFHGKTSLISHHGKKLFANIPTPFNVMRYHSLVVSENNLPRDFSIDATTEDGTIMAISHRKYPAFGLQFHPESILSEHGLLLLENFLNVIPIF